MSLTEIRQIRERLEGLPIMASVEMSAQELHELLDLAEVEAKRREDRTRPLKPLGNVESKR